MAKSTLKNKHAAIYARYSSHAQNDASIEQQVDKCRAFAEHEGIIIDAVYADRAMTGTNDKRPEFQRMLKDAEAGKFTVLLAWKSNRIGRNMMEAMINDARLSQCGVVTRYIEEAFDDSAAGRFALRSMMNLNQFYSENLAEDVKRGMEDAARQGKAMCSLPFGYKRDPETGKPVIDPARADIVREIFRRYLDGETKADLMNDLNARGIKTGYNRLWNKNSFRTILRNEAYIGKYKYKQILIDGGYPQIVDRVIFDKVQLKLARRTEVNGRRRDNVYYVLTGKAFCGHCGEALVGYSGVSANGTPHYYYVCNGRRLKHGCKKKNMRKDELEMLVAQAIVDNVLSRDDVLDWMVDEIMALQKRIQESSQLEYYKEQLRVREAEMDRIVDAVTKGMYSDRLRDRMNELEAEVQELKPRVEFEEKCTPHYDADMIRFYLERFRGHDVHDQAYREALFSQFLDRVDVYDDRLKVTFSGVDDDVSLDEGNCSDKGNSSPLYVSDTNTIELIGTMFVLTVRFST